jgi:hypothetical protein
VLEDCSCRLAARKASLTGSLAGRVGFYLNFEIVSGFLNCLRRKRETVRAKCLRIARGALKVAMQEDTREERREIKERRHSGTT